VTRVLVVEDEESYSEALAYMLRKEGFEVAIAADGNAALTEFDRNGADIVLLDLMLPGIPGSIRSSSTMSAPFRSNSVRAALPSAAMATSNPSLRSM